MKNGRNEASDNALESPSAAELVSIKFLVAVDIREGGADVTTRSYPNLWRRVGYRRRSPLVWKLEIFSQRCGQNTYPTSKVVGERRVI